MKRKNGMEEIVLHMNCACKKKKRAMAKKGAARRLAQNNKRLGILALVLAASLVR